MMRERVQDWGERGKGLVVLYHEPARSRYTVERFVRGVARRETFRYGGAITKSAAKAEAKACALACFEAQVQRTSRGDQPATMTALYERYVTAMEGGWRPATRTSNLYRWRLWSAFAHPETDPNGITEDTLDDFVKRLRQGGTAPNQIRATVALVRTVYTLGLKRGWVTQPAPVTYALRLAKNERSIEPAEYHPDEWRRLVAACNPADPSQWRIYTVLLLQGAQGQRISSVRQLMWPEVDEAAGTILWAADRMKQGVDFVQPLTDTARTALEVAKTWRAAEGYTGPYVLYAPGRAGGKGGSTAKGWGEQAVAYATIHAALRAAELRAGVPHIKHRATHGNRKMAAGNVYAGTNDLLAAAEWIGDKDAKQLKHYLKRHDERLTAGAAAAEKGAFLSADRTSDRTYGVYGGLSEEAKLLVGLDLEGKPQVGFEPTTAALDTPTTTPETATECGFAVDGHPAETPETRPNTNLDRTRDRTQRNGAT